MSIIHGSRGLIYFVHQFKPGFKEAALLDDPETLRGVTRINAEVQALAPVIFHETDQPAISVSTTPEMKVAMLSRKLQGTNYLFAVNLRNEKATVRFSGDAFATDAPVELIGEDRHVAAKKSILHDEFEPYAVRLYRWKND